jgi:hypothetical protein
MKFMTIYRWTEKTARAAMKRWYSMFDGTAPQVVLDAVPKINTISIVTAPQEHMTFQTWEVAETDMEAVWAIVIYLQDVVTMETHLVTDIGDDWNRAWDKVDLLNSVPKPEW